MLGFSLTVILLVMFVAVLWLASKHGSYIEKQIALEAKEKAVTEAKEVRDEVSKLNSGDVAKRLHRWRK